MPVAEPTAIPAPAARPLLAAFAAGVAGPWQLDRLAAVIGDGLPWAPRLAVLEPASGAIPAGLVWTLRGTTSHARYTTRGELDALATVQQGLGRQQANCAALIPIRKSESWWTLAQDERRAIIAQQSRHIPIGLDYLPAVARRLYHGRDLGEPFDFLTWFEYAPVHAQAFEELVKRLRDTAEWRFVDREIDIRLRRD